jgi:hypothetical protein
MSTKQSATLEAAETAQQRAQAEQFSFDTSAIAASLRQTC